MTVGCAGFAKKIFSLQSKTKRNEIHFACVSHAHVKKRKKLKRNKINVFSLCFASKRNKINVFSLLFTIPGIDMKK